MVITHPKEMNNKIELRKILNKNLPVVEALKDYKKLNENWPDIHLLVDLQDHDQIINCLLYTSDAADE